MRQKGMVLDLIGKTARLILTLGITVLAAVFLGGNVIASPASAADAPKITQHYNGKLLPWDKETWNGATSCAVVSATDVYCFDTVAESRAFTSEQAQAAPASTQGYDCSDWTYLNAGGHHLQFRDWGYWQNLVQWIPVPAAVTSWSNEFNTCKSYFRNAGGACHYIAPGTGTIYFSAPYPLADQIFLQKPSNPPAPGC